MGQPWVGLDSRRASAIQSSGLLQVAVEYGIPSMFVVTDEEYLDLKALPVTAA